MSLPSPSPASAPASASAAAPTQAELLDFVRRAAADAELIASLPLDPEGRTWVRLAGPGGSEAWLIGWPPGTGTGWHDHADSVGAFVTAAGELKENALAARLPTDGWKTLELSEGVDRGRLLTAGQGRGFGRHRVPVRRLVEDLVHVVPAEGASLADGQPAFPVHPVVEFEGLPAVGGQSGGERVLLEFA